MAPIAQCGIKLPELQDGDRGMAVSASWAGKGPRPIGILENAVVA